MHRSGRSSQSDEEGSEPMVESNIEQDEANVGHVPNSSTGDGVPKKRRAKRTAGTSQRSDHVSARENHMVSQLSNVCALLQRELKGGCVTDCLIFVQGSITYKFSSESLEGFVNPHLKEGQQKVGLPLLVEEIKSEKWRSQVWTDEKIARLNQAYPTRGSVVHQMSVELLRSFVRNVGTGWCDMRRTLAKVLEGKSTMLSHLEVFHEDMWIKLDQTKGKRARGEDDNDEMVDSERDTLEAQQNNDEEREVADDENEATGKNVVYSVKDFDRVMSLENWNVRDVSESDDDGEGRIVTLGAVDGRTGLLHKAIAKMDKIELATVAAFQLQILQEGEMLDGISGILCILAYTRAHTSHTLLLVVCTDRERQAYACAHRERERGE